MKTKPSPLKLATLALLPAALIAFTSCSTPGGDEQVVALESASGAAIVDTYQTTATVTAIDSTARKVTLTMAGGKRTTVKCGPQVVNFSQIQINDRLNVTITEELAVFLGQGNPPTVAGGAGVALAPVGAKPGGVVASTVQVTAKITALDAKTRKVTLQFVDGTIRTIKAGKQVNLSGVKPGDDVTVQYTEAMALTMEKP
jgi:Cu/Ag efflux protein CusF